MESASIVLQAIFNTTTQPMPSNDTTGIVNNGGPNVPEPIISNGVLWWVQLTNFIGLCGVISILGIVANIINIIVFIRQGIMSDSSNVSLLGLAVSDLMCVLTLLWFSICFAIIYINPEDLAFHPMSMLVVTAGRPHGMFVQITCFITVYISLERCMCVLFPLKFKLLFTAKRTAIIIPSIFVLIISIGFIPLYMSQYLAWTTIPGTNRSILVIHETSNYLEIYKIFSYLNAQIARTFSLLSVFIFTQITEYKLRASSKWRKTIISSANAPNNITADKAKAESKNVKNKKAGEAVSNKEKKLVRMIRVICIIFLVCYTGDLICVTSERIQPEIRPGGRYNNVFFFMYAFSFVFGAINSSCNILVYYTMSTKYRTEFRKLFGLFVDNDKEGGKNKCISKNISENTLQSSFSKTED